MNAQEEPSNLFKQKRDEYLVEIRKKKNTDHLREKRTKLANGPKDLSSQSDAPQVPLNELAVSFIRFCQEGNIPALQEIAKVIREKVSENDDPPILELADTDAIRYIVEMLKPSFWEAEKLLIEVSWIVANIASREQEHVNFLVGLDVIPLAIDLFGHPNMDVKENALWIIANICGDSPVYRNVLLDVGIVPHLDTLFSCEGLPEAMVESMFWLISNLCRGNPYPDFSQVIPVLSHIQKYIKKSDNPEILKNCLITLKYMVDTDDESQLQVIIDLDITRDIIDILTDVDTKYAGLILNIIGRIVLGSSEQAEVVIDAGAIKAVAPLLHHESKEIVKRACWLYSNILADSEDSASFVFQYNKGAIIKDLMEKVLTEGQDIVEECLYALANACSNGDEDDIKFLVKLDLIELLIEACDRISSSDILKACVGALEDILRVGEDIGPETSPEENPYNRRMLEYNGYDKLERLQINFTKEVFEIIERILENYGP